MNATQSIWLRPVTPDDSPLLQLWRSEPSVRRFQPLSQLSTSRLSSELASQSHSDLRVGRGQRFDWIVLFGQRPVGWITLAIQSWEQGVGECGYSLATAFQGQGIMTRALTLWIEEIFSQTELFRLEARCLKENRASRVILQHLGFQLEGTLRGYLQLHGEREDSDLFSLLRTDPRPTAPKD